VLFRSLLKSETVPPDDDVRVAPVMLSWKISTVTPAGGVSVTDKLTGTSAGFVLTGVVVTWDGLPHPDINRRNNTMKRNCTALRIFAS
jgi:hypothetical protein